MEFPKEFIEKLQETDFEVLIEKPYKDFCNDIDEEKKKWIEIGIWLESIKVPPIDWVLVFFDYIERLSKSIRETESYGDLEYAWRGYNELRDVLKSTFTELIKKNANKKECLAEVKERFLLLIDNNKSQVVLSREIFSLMISVRSYDGLKEEWNLNEDEKEFVKSFFLEIINKFIVIGEAHRHSIRGIGRLRSHTYFLWKEINNLWDKDDFIIKHRMTLFELSFHHPKRSSLNCKSYIRALYKKENELGKLVIPAPNLLLEEGRKQFESNKTEAILFLSLNYLFEGIAAGVADMAEIKRSLEGGGNLNNDKGITSISDALLCIRVFIKEERVISAYLAKYIVGDEQLFVFMKGITAGDHELIGKEEENKVVQSICKALYNPASDEPGQVDVKLMCVRWGLLNKTVLPEAYQIKIPKKLPNDAEGAFGFFEQLRIEGVYELEEGATEDMVSDMPEEVREVYLMHDGSDQREFLPASDARDLLEDIYEWRDIHLSRIGAKKTDNIILEGLRVDEVNISHHLHDDLLPIGQRSNGDVCFIDPKTKSITGQAIVICYDHESCLTGKLIANSFAEYLCREFIGKFEHLYGRDDELRALLDTEVKIVE